MMGSHVVVLSSSDATIDLLEQRSVVYADRVCKRSVSSSRSQRLPNPPLASVTYGERTVRVIVHACNYADKRRLITGWGAFGPPPQCLMGVSGAPTASYSTVSSTYLPQVSSTTRSTRQ